MTSVQRLCQAACVSLLLSACTSSKGSDTASLGATLLPLSIDVPRASVVVGFEQGRLRATVELPGYRISTHPITREQMQACIASGACAAAEPACESEGTPLAGLKADAPDSPALCVSPPAAQAFCSWVGGRLPRLGEWLHAARGTQPKRFAWELREDLCELHPRLEVVAPAGNDASNSVVRSVPCGELRDSGVLKVGDHRAGASPLGLQDVLMAPAELLGTEHGSLFSACDSRFDACLIGGSVPGAIESVEPIRALHQDELTAPPKFRVRQPYAFRCVLEES